MWRTLALLFVLHFPPTLVDAPRISQLADSLGVPASVALSVGWEESRDGSMGNRYLGRGNAHGECKELGRFQINPCYTPTRIHPSCTVSAITRSYDKNVACGIMLIRQLFDRTGNWPDAIEHYNGSGPGAVAYRQRVLVNVALFTLDRLKSR